MASLGDKGLFPGRDNQGKYTGDWGINSKAFRQSTRSDFLGRAGIFAAGGSGYKREALSNAFGLLSHNQRVRNNYLTKVGVPLGTAVSLYSSIESDDPIENFGTNVGTITGASVGFRFGQALGHAQARGVGELPTNFLGRMRMGARAAAFGTSYGLVGLAAGAALGAGVMYTAFQSAKNSNNFIRKFATEKRNADFNHNLVQTREGLTMRQRALQKLNISSLNNRGTVLGNEASVMAGVYR